MFASLHCRRAGEKIELPVPMEEMITCVCRQYGLKPAAFAGPGKKRNCSEAWAMIPLLVWHEDHLSLRDLRTRLGCKPCIFSQAVNRLRTRAETNPRVAAKGERTREDQTQIQICQA